METSVWDESLASFCDSVAARKPAPAGVAAAAVAANLGLSLLAKTLAITGARPDLLEAVQRESALMKDAADEDVAAVRAYLSSRTAETLENAIEVPMRAARSAVRGLDLCAEAADSMRAPLAADLGAAAALLAGAVRAMLICVEANGGPAEREELESRAVRQAGAVVRRIRMLL
jgi:formiminotetrahydrofolate cyclodeaminase